MKNEERNILGWKKKLTFAHAEEYFASANIPFCESNKKTLSLLDGDGYYTNTALLISDQCEHSIKCAVYEGRGKPNSRHVRSFTVRY